MRRHVLVVPVVSGEALMNCRIRNRCPVIDLQLTGVIPGRREIKAADAAVLERWGGIVRSVECAAQYRRSENYIQSVVGGNVEELMLARDLMTMSPSVRS